MEPDKDYDILTLDDYLELAKDSATISNIEHAIVTPCMRRAFAKELEDTAKRGTGENSSD